MTELTDKYLDKLLNQHTSGNIHDTVLAIKSHLATLGNVLDVAHRAALVQKVDDLKTVLEHDLLEESRSGEDFINDSVFHAAHR